MGNKSISPSRTRLEVEMDEDEDEAEVGGRVRAMYIATRWADEHIVMKMEL